MALGINLKFYINLPKGVKLKVRKLLGLILTFVEVTGEKLVLGGGGGVAHFLPPILNRVKESCLPDCWKVSSVVSVLKNDGERSTAKNYRPVRVLSVVSKVFEKLVNSRIVDHLEKSGLFSDFQDGFRSSQSTADLLCCI